MDFGNIVAKAYLEQRKIAIGFNIWMKKNDTVEKAEEFFHFTDEDMFDEFYKTL